jgi:hypothetical protein
MPASRNHSRQPVLAAGDDDSPVTVLRQLEEERGKMFTEAEYRTMRAAVLHELAPGTRLRPFTLFTVAVVAAGLVAMLVIGLAVATRKSVGDYVLAIVSGIALVAVGYFWCCLRGVRQDVLRPLDARLAELEALWIAKLVSSEEYHRLQAHILIARQRQGQ